ncbi:MAG: two-component regulator propeller domain-containing protein [Ferruginibacter sp.]
MKGLYLLLLIFSVTCCKAQNPYNFYHLFLDKGLSDARVNDIVQDKFGFMWFATPNGLNRYDGYSIKNYYFSQDTYSLPSNNIISLYSSKKGDLWIGTSAGAVRYDFGNDRFIRFDTTRKEEMDIGKTLINDFAEDKQGNVYVACAAGVLRVLTNENKWQNVNSIMPAGSRLRFVRRLKFFSSDILYATTYGNIPLFKINLTDKTYDSIDVLKDTLAPNMYGIEKISNDEMMGGLLSNGIVCINTNNKEIRTVPGVLTKNDSIKYNTVYDILKDSRGRIWIASFYFRLAEYLPKTNEIITFQKDALSPYGYDGTSAICVFEDRQHNIWIGTGGKGVYRFNPDNNAVKFTSGNDHETNALQSGRVLSLVSLDNNTLLVGTENGPSFYDYTKKKHTNFKGISTTGIDAPLEYVQCGMKDDNGIIWMGTNRLGLMRYDTKTGKYRCFSRVTKPYPLIDDGVSELLKLPDGNIFLIGWGRPGIFNTKTYEYISYRNDTLNPVFKLNGVTTICYDAKQNIWLSTSTGKLYQYIIAEKKLTDKSDLLKTIKDLKSIFTITWKGDELFLATNAGLVILKDNHKLRIFSIRHIDNKTNEVRGLLPDGKFVWFCNTRILGKLEPATGKIFFLGERDGLSNVLLFSNTLMRSSQGTILIGSNKGYYEISGDKIRENSTSSAPYLTGFRVYDKPIVSNEAISGLKTISLTYNQNFFAFEMSAFNYEEAEDMEYAYMLEGFDNDWQYTGKQRSGSYTNVPGGKYLLRLKARNSSGDWNENGQKLSIIIAKHFTATWWFRILLLSLITALMYLLYRNRIRRINKEARLRSDYEIKLNELENSALRTQMNPHFIFNSLNTINSFISRNETLQAHQYISKFSKLIRYILDHSRKRKILLSDELEVLNLYIQIERIRFDNKFDYDITIADDIDPSTVELPPLIIQPFVENAILHGLLPMDKKGFLQVTVVHKENMLLCTVEDNGIGRENAKALNRTFIPKHKSHGIEITLKRIELFNKENGREGKVIISDCTTNDKNTGTKVEIPVAWEESF